ncbi:MAG: hypothetical protein AAF989_13145, partial [Planctomycetota bacterium]
DPEPEPDPMSKPDPKPDMGPDPETGSDPDGGPNTPDGNGNNNEGPTEQPQAPAPKSGLADTRPADRPFNLANIGANATARIESSSWYQALDWRGAFVGEEYQLKKGQFDAYQAEAWTKLKLAAEQLSIHQAMDQFEQDVEERNSILQVSAGAASSLSAGAAAGLALWCMSGTYLASLLFSSLPAWIRFDPIYVIQQTTCVDDHDETSVADIISGRMKSTTKTVS